MEKHKRIVLFVDDEKEILNSITRQLRNSEFTVVCAGSSSEALQILSKKNIQVLITDEKMPTMTGIELLQKVKTQSPDTIRMILSGYTDSKTLIQSINRGEVYRFIAKPWKKNELTEIIKEGFTQYNTLQCNKVYMKRLIDENIALIKKLDLRDTALEINADILDMLPQPAIVVSDDNRAVLINKEFLSFFRKQTETGTPVNEIFPGQTGINIITGTELPGGQTSFETEHNGQNIRVFTRTLRSRDKFKAVVFFEELC